MNRLNETLIIYYRKILQFRQRKYGAGTLFLRYLVGRNEFCIYIQKFLENFFQIKDISMIYCCYSCTTAAGETAPDPRSAAWMGQIVLVAVGLPLVLDEVSMTMPLNSGSVELFAPSTWAFCFISLPFPHRTPYKPTTINTTAIMLFHK